MITKTCLNCRNTHICCVKCGTWHSMAENDCEHVWGIMFDCRLREDNPNVVVCQWWEPMDESVADGFEIIFNDL